MALDEITEDSGVHDMDIPSELFSLDGFQSAPSKAIFSSSAHDNAFATVDFKWDSFFAFVLSKYRPTTAKR